MSHALIASDGTWAYVDAPHEAHILIYDSLKYHPDGYQHVWSFQNDRWDGYNRLYDISNRRFRRGLLPRVTRILETGGYDVISSPPSTNEEYHADYSIKDTSMRPIEFQAKAADAISNSMMGIVASPTGSGKTYLLALALDKMKLRSIILVTDVVLLDQMQLALEKYFDTDIGMIGDGEFSLKDITVSTIQSMLSILRGKTEGSAAKKKKLLAHLDTISAVFSDEAHLYDSDGVSEIMPFFKKANRYYGLSATPYGWAEKAEKVANLELEQHFGGVIYDTRKLNFVSIGLRVPLVVDVRTRTPINDKYDKHFKQGRRGVKLPDYTKNYRECLDTEILNNPSYIDDIVSYATELSKRGESVFIHASHSIKFGEEISKLIDGSELVNGKTPRLKRREIYDRLRSKDLKILVSDVGGTGLDIPSLNAIIMASDLKDVRQLIGRVIRKAPDKEYGMVIDVKTNCNFLKKHHEIRRAQYSLEHAIITG